MHPLGEDALRTLRLTRFWLHYGAVAAVAVLTLVAAIEGLAGQ